MGKRDNAAPLRYADFQELIMSVDELFDEIVSDRPELLARLSPEERLRGLGPEERLRGLGPEERLRGLDADQVLAALDGLPAEQRALLLRRLQQ